MYPIALLSLTQFLPKEMEQWPGTRSIQMRQIIEQRKINSIQTAVKSNKDLHRQHSIHHRSMAILWNTYTKRLGNLPKIVASKRR